VLVADDYCLWGARDFNAFSDHHGTLSAADKYWK